MDLGFKDQVAFVTGASRGLGFAIARTLALEGATIAICSRNKERIEGAAKSIEIEANTSVLPIVADLSVPQEPERFFTEASLELGPPHAIVIVTGGPPSLSFEETTQHDWVMAGRQVLDPVHSLIRACLPAMKSRRYGRILVLTSIAVKSPMPNMVLSNALRMAVTGLVKTVAMELASWGITANTICPGFFSTARLSQLAEVEGKRRGVNPGVIFSEMARKVPVGRLGDPEELAQLAVFLVSKKAGYITGTAIPVDGGLYGGI